MQYKYKIALPYTHDQISSSQHIEREGEGEREREGLVTISALKILNENHSENDKQILEQTSRNAGFTEAFHGRNIINTSIT